MVASLLALGSRGEGVAALQRKLNARLSGIAPLVVDGDFGPKTEASVIAFQKERHLRVDGIAGPATLAELDLVPIVATQPEDPAQNGLLIEGVIIPVPGVKVIGPHDAAWAHLAPGDAIPRKVWPQMWIWHKTIADDPEKVRPGKGPAGGARRTADYWRDDPHYSGTQLVTGHDGELACLADLVRVEAFHATVSNLWSVGQETCELFGGFVYEAALLTTLESTLVGCEHIGIQLQMPRLGSYTGHPIRRMELDGGRDMVGIFGHRDNTEERGKWDPGEVIWEMAAKRGVEQFDFARGQDLLVWKDRQGDLVKKGHRLTIDGIAGPATTAALKLEGYRNGIWALGRASFHG